MRMYESIFELRYSRVPFIDREQRVSVPDRERRGNIAVRFAALLANWARQAWAHAARPGRA